MAAFDDEKWYCLKSGIIIQLPRETKIIYKYLLGLLNSSLMDFLYHDLVNEDNRIFPEVKPIQLFKLPIKIATDELQKQVEMNIENIIALKKENPEADTTVFETQIDHLVYALYDLTAEEIAIVEGGVK